ncbi:SDR family NAD(P)-dependent oxidoreductase [Actinacidiphila glaucinigra]|uniref:Short chain dehydrogenase n=1 Tax=Actinacidiphila glaucinigra TaxID=235986 RepID=A0A239N7F5_9ACTN|nr:SDR family NAD(P)-dependent oxidoreductase [Actinacidiphila glaucinigra]SNT50670.1 short chain dehydrogenase [Actinacidiphila glaucinigra]
MSVNTIAVITGGNRGLGRATALALGAAGTDVVLTYRSNEKEAAEVVEALTAMGRKAAALRLDTTSFGELPAFARTLGDTLRATWGRETFDFLVNNAGTAGFSPLGATGADDFDLMVDVHFKGVFFPPAGTSRPWRCGWSAPRSPPPVRGRASRRTGR